MRHEHRLAAVTTFDERGYEVYGRRFLETFAAHWPSEVRLYVYAEGFRPVLPRGELRDLLACCPGLVRFKRDYVGIRPRDFRWDAVRFAHKVFALTHAARTTQVEKLFWLDADTLSFADVPVDFLRSCLPDNCFTSCLVREGMHSETGFVGYNLGHVASRDFIAAFEGLYTSGRLFALPEWHDSYVFDVVRRSFERQGRIRTHNLSGVFTDTSHPFVNSELGRYMDHLKGPRKEEGRSRESDLILPRSETYWQLVDGGGI
jgi:hypothetical protein